MAERPQHLHFSFDQWWWQLRSLARLKDWPLSAKDQYREYYDDGDSPETALESEMLHDDTKVEA